MNQRVKKSNKGKGNQDISASVMNTGGHVVSHSRDNEPVIRTPQKATGDVPAEKLQGLAKASPFLKKIKDVVTPKSKEEERRVIAQSTEKVVESNDKKKTEKENDSK
jgi:hypothetical protein